MRRPFTLYKEKTKSGIVWYARFWDEETQKYKHSRSTGIIVEGKKERHYEAEEAARKLCEEFSIVKITTETIASQKADLITSTKQEQNPISPIIKTVANTPLIEYLTNFWTTESEYAIYKRDVKNKPLTLYYLDMNHDDIRRHVEPFKGFEGVTVGSLTKAMLKKWLIWLAGRRKTRIKKDGTIIDEGTISGRRANSILQSVRVAVRWAFDSEEIPADPFYKLGEVSENLKEKGVLSFEERTKLTQLPVTEKNYLSRLAIFLGSFCGLRRGEMRGLQWGDITNGLITVQHNYINGEGVKLPKYNSVRKVPITSDVQRLLDIARGYAKNITPSTFVLESPKTKGLPVSNNFFRDRFKIELQKIGITAEQQDERLLSCHSLRHTFITLAELSGVPDVVIRALAGHKSAQVQRKYSHAPQVINFDEARMKLENNGVFEIKNDKYQKTENEQKAVNQ
jgi:integrase